MERAFAKINEKRNKTVNAHLEPIFKIVIPYIEKSGINYWVYGGVAIAGIKGYFYREHQDVDIFVLDKDYEKAIKIIKETSDANSWILKPARLVRNRPKNELFIASQERLSIIPVYERDNNEAELVFPYGSRRFLRELLEPILRQVGALKYYTPSEYIVKELLHFYIEALVKSGKLIRRKDLWDKYKQDTEELLGSETVKKFFTEKT